MIAAEPKPARAPLLEVRGLQKTFSSRPFLARATHTCAARDVSFRIAPGEAVALVGQSGSGKSTIARMLLRLESPDGGEVRLAGELVLGGGRGRVPGDDRRQVRGYRGRVQMVFQDPFGSLNPVHRVGHHLERPLVRHGVVADEPGASAASTGAPRLRRRIPKAELRRHVLDLLRTVGLDPPEEFIGRYPHELSGGQRQRVAIARALAVAPELLVADEPTSMLDVSIRMGVLNLLAQLKRERGLAILLITHDLASARYLADRILVLYRGRLVEDGPSEEIVAAPAHPYTRALLESIASAGRPTPPSAASRSVPGGVDGAGCPFAARCPECLPVCLATDPEPRALGLRQVRCHLVPAEPPARKV